MVIMVMMIMIHKLLENRDYFLLLLVPTEVPHPVLLKFNRY